MQFIQSELILTESCRSGSLEQALVDAVGRCVAGCGKRKDLRDSLTRHFGGRRRSALLDQLAKTPAFIDNRDAKKREMLATSKHVAHDDTFKQIREMTKFVDRRFLTHSKSLADLRAMLESSSVHAPWKSSYCMERITIAEDLTKADLRTLRRDNALVCRVCGKNGRVADKTIRRCGRCKVATYCSATCQAADWPSHKRDCVRQRSTTTLPGNELHRPAQPATDRPIPTDSTIPTESARARSLGCIPAPPSSLERETKKKSRDSLGKREEKVSRARKKL
mmetsp:Transcript_13076/g.39518  ORF Transcript_13076/g.39518 Transcript_13076/m.39518 type:complete len:279 (-) Transcript_13076:20-856(-)